MFKRRLLKNPEEVFKEFGIATDRKASFKFHFDDKEHFHLNLPIKPKEEEVSEEDLKLITGGLNEDTAFGIMAVAGLGIAAAML